MRRRGFTLLEVLVALGVLGVVLGLSMPALIARVDRGSFESNAERLAGAVRLAKEAAREAGQPVTVRARTLETGVTVIEGGAGVTRTARPADEGPPGSSEEQSWTTLTELAPGLSLSERDPGLADDLNADRGESIARDEWPDEIPDFETLLAPSQGPATGGQTRTLCVFLPSAESIVQGPVYLIETPRAASTPPKRWASLTVSAWTGRVLLEQHRATSAVETLAPDGDDGASLMETLPYDGGAAP